MRRILEATIGQLSELSAELSAEVSEQTVNNVLTSRGRVCKEALMSAAVLTAKLETLRTAPANDHRQMQFGICEECKG